MTRNIPRLATAALIGCLSLGLAAPAMAQDEPPPEEAGTEEAVHREPRARCLEAIDRRLDSLARAQARIDEVQAITPLHEAAVDDIIDSTQSGLTRLSNQVEAADDPATLVRLCATVAPDYRVYLVVLPQAHLTVGADRAQAGAEIGYAVIDTLDTAIAEAEAAGADVSDAVMYRDRSLAHLEAADAANDGVAASVLSVTPDSFNTGNGGAALAAARVRLRNAHDELDGAEQAALAAGEALRDALGDLA